MDTLNLSRLSVSKKTTESRFLRVIGDWLGPALLTGQHARAALEQVDIRAKYAGYLRREKQAIARFAGRESRPIPASFDYARVSGLRNESREKLRRISPRSLGQAGRIPGLTPADLMILMVHLDRGTA